MYEELYAPIPDVLAYLERLGLGGYQVEVSEAALSRLVCAHLTHIPFEDIDVWTKGICPSLAIPELFDKMIAHRRGGYCFELNSLFCALLRALGFDAYTAAAHIVTDKDYLPPPTHCVVLVCIGEEKYFCDVGFGGNMPLCALRLEEGQQGDFRIEREGDYYALYTPIGRTLCFRDVKAEPVDLVPLNFHKSQKPDSPFRAELIMNLRFEDGSAAIKGRSFKYRHDGEVIEKEISSEGELRETIEKYFGIPTQGIELGTI